jgi:hypothetical protein
MRRKFYPDGGEERTVQRRRRCVVGVLVDHLDHFIPHQSLSSIVSMRQIQRAYDKKKRTLSKSFSRAHT